MWKAWRSEWRGVGQEDPHFCSKCLGGWEAVTELEGGPAEGESWVCPCHTLPPTTFPPTEGSGPPLHTQE